MTCFCMHSVAQQTALVIFLLGVMLSEMVLITLKYSNRGLKWRYFISDICVMAILMILQEKMDRCAEQEPCIAPLSIVWIIIVSVAALCYVILCTVHEVRNSKKELPVNAIQRSVDGLPMGLCFADSLGRIVLINRKMGELGSIMLGHFPQMIQGLLTAIEQSDAESPVVRIQENPILHLFPDGSVWRFQVMLLPQPVGFTQVSAQDVTQFYNGNKQLLADNVQMRRVNKEIREMYDRMADQIREQENLDLKIRIHDNIGSSLIAITDIISHPNPKKADEQVAMLRDAVNYFANDRPAADGTFAVVQQKAADINVELSLNGYLPPDTMLEELVAAAAQECVTNCVHHAGGNRVQIDVFEHKGIGTVRITNNGEAPKKEIVEGGGLSNLRRRVEGMGGEMYLAHKPCFVLTINLPWKEWTK